jgi:GT2 family glycosyltransferase
VIAFAACVADQEKLSRFAAPGLQRAMEPGAVFAELSTDTSIHEAYNEALEHFAGYEDLEALVLLHEDAELLDHDFCARVRTVLADPDVAIAGAVGARGVTGLDWWNGELTGRALETRGIVQGDEINREVDAVDGLLLVLSPWAVRELRCDVATFTGFHAYDVDLCFQARRAGRRVVTAPLNVFHHTKGGFGDAAAWKRANEAFHSKWAVVLPTSS